jgi:hypothetical protein
MHSGWLTRGSHAGFAVTARRWATCHGALQQQLCTGFAAWTGALGRFALSRYVHFLCLDVPSPALCWLFCRAGNELEPISWLADTALGLILRGGDGQAGRLRALAVRSTLCLLFMQSGVSLGLRLLFL